MNNSLNERYSNLEKRFDELTFFEKRFVELTTDIAMNANFLKSLRYNLNEMINKFVNDVEQFIADGGKWNYWR